MHGHWPAIGVVGYTRRVRSLAAAVGVCLALWPWAGTSAVAGERRVVEYEIDAVLDPATHTLTGRQTVRWRNTTSVPTSEIWLHLYLNAFASSESTFMRELAADAPGWIDVEDRDWGWTRITRFALGDGTDLLDGTSFERPDDGNVEDHTVVRAELPRAVQPGSAETFELEFEARLPRVIARTGYADDFYFVGQWFPKLGVFEGESGWNCHQFHAAGEFFADFGSYRVRLTVPRGWVVGATGELVSRSPVGTDDVLEFHAYDVHDFAWTTASGPLRRAGRGSWRSWRRTSIRGAMSPRSGSTGLGRRSASAPSSSSCRRPRSA